MLSHTQVNQTDGTQKREGGGRGAERERECGRCGRRGTEKNR